MRQDLVTGPLSFLDHGGAADLTARGLPEQQARLLDIPKHLQVVRENADAVSAELVRARQDVANGDGAALDRAAVLQRRLGELQAAGQHALRELPGAVRDLQAARDQMRLPKLSVFDGLETRARDALAASGQSAAGRDDVFRPPWFEPRADSLLPVSDILAGLGFPEIAPKLDPAGMLDFMRQLREAPGYLGMLHAKIEALRAELSAAEEYQRAGLIGSDPWIKSLNELIPRLEGAERDASAAVEQATAQLQAVRESLGLGVTRDQFWLSSVRKDVSLGDNLPRDLEPGAGLSSVLAKWHGDAGWPARPPDVSTSVVVESDRPVKLLGKWEEMPWLGLDNRLPVSGSHADLGYKDALVAPPIARVLESNLAGMRAGGAAGLEDRLTALRVRLRSTPAYQATDANMRAHIDTIIEEFRGEALQAPDPFANVRPGAGISPVTVVSFEESGKIGIHRLTTADGEYLALRARAGSLSLLETPFNILRPEWGSNTQVKLAELQLGHLPLGLDWWLQGIFSFGPGHRIVQALDRGWEVGIRTSGSGPLFIMSRWDRMPVDSEGNFLVSEAELITRLNAFIYLSVNPTIYVPGVGPVDFPGMWPNLTADFTGIYNQETGVVTWTGEIAPALVSNFDPRDTFLQMMVQALPDSVRSIINSLGTTPDVPLDMSSIALVQGPALPVDWLVKWMERPLTQFFQEHGGLTPPGAKAGPKAPAAVQPPFVPAEENPIARELGRSTTDLYNEIGVLGVQIEKLDQQLGNGPGAGIGGQHADKIDEIQARYKRELEESAALTKRVRAEGSARTAALDAGPGSAGPGRTLPPP
ncbi:MAG: hypothetical protein M3Y33_19130, partial [Actinomycetota bacterium]|nr:hypothetical protein [Actinomycetota bacterium]